MRLPACLLSFTFHLSRPLCPSLHTLTYPPGAWVDRIRRAGIESVVSSSRFRLRTLPPASGPPPGGGYSAIDWGADYDVLLIGTNKGQLGEKSTAVRGRGDPRHPRRVEWQYGVSDRVLLEGATVNGQVCLVLFGYRIGRLLFLEVGGERRCTP